MKMCLLCINMPSNFTPISPCNWLKPVWCRTGLTNFDTLEGHMILHVCWPKAAHVFTYVEEWELISPDVDWLTLS